MIRNKLQNNINVLESKKSEIIFFIYFSLQFLFIIMNTFLEIKMGAFTLLLTLIMGPIILLRCAAKNYDLSHAKNGMMYLFILPAVYYAFLLSNPNNVQEAWNIAIAPYWLYPFMLAVIVPIAIRNIKGIEWLLIIWSIFIIIGTLKGAYQKTYGFTDKEKYFLYVLGGHRTHIIWSGIRYFSFFTDAANFGVHSAMAATTFFIASIYLNKKILKIYFVLIATLALYSMAISGTRAAVVIPIVGILSFSILSKNWKAFGCSIILFTVIFSFFYYTNIGSSNPYIYKMRSAFRPTKDASYMVRLQNRAKMAELMRHRPFGYGLGLSKGERFNPKELMPYPPDSWLISIWVETGIVGLIIYGLTHLLLFILCGHILIFKIKDKSLRGLLSAWICMAIGFFVAAYVNDVMQYPNPIVLYTGFALCFSGKYIDKDLAKFENKPLLKNKNIRHLR